jgi:hypothetical protein
MILSIFFMGSHKVLADENEHLYVKNVQISDVEKKELKDYVNSNFGSSLAGLLFFENDLTDTAQYVLGNEFSIFSDDSLEGESFYFPVFFEGKIKYIYSVIKTNEHGYSGSIAKFFADELEAFRKCNENEVITLYANSYSIYAETKNNVELLYASPIIPSSEISEESLTSDKETEVVDIHGINSFDIVDNSSEIFSRKRQRSIVQTASNYALINWKITETQGSEEPWCAAYVAAAILNNKVDSRPTKAVDILNYTFPKLTPAQRWKSSVSQDQIVKYGKYRGVNPIRVDGTLYHSTVESNLRKGNAIYLGTSGYGQVNKSRHAFALHGWINYGSNRIYEVWNPWYNQTMIIQANTYPMTISVPGGGFVWDVTIYNW